MKITTSIKPFIESLLIQRNCISQIQLAKLSLKISAQTPLESLLLTHNILNKNQLEYFIQDAYQLSQQNSSPPKTEWIRTTSNPRQIGSYQVIEELARGGMGIVYKAKHQQLGTIVALKVIIAGENASNEMIARFQREAKLTAKLKHPGIVQVHDFGRVNGQYYFSMEYVEGKTLDQLLLKDISPRNILFLFQKILLSLHYAHQQKIIHRDLKPSNIFITKNGEPKIGDFGLAKEIHLDRQTQKLTKANEIMGTPAYMSPEQVCGEEKLGATTDIYAIGICLYQALTRHFPFEGNTYHEIFYKVLHEEIPSPVLYNKSLHQDLESIILKSLQKEKSKRYQTALTFANDLGRFLQGSPILARPIQNQEKFYKWVSRNFRSLLVAFSFFIFLFILLIIQQYQKGLQQKQKISFHLQQAEKEVLHSKQVLFQSKKQKSEKISYLLKAINHLNEALMEKPSLSIERKKLEIGKMLIKLTCQNQEYALAYYIARDLRELSIVKEFNYRALLKKVTREQKKKLLQNLRIFSYWQERLQQKELNATEIEDAIFEISKMEEEEIFQKLITIMKEASRYFLHPSNNSLILSQYYNTMLAALTRQENQLAGPYIFEILNKNIDILKEKTMGKRPAGLLNFSINLAQALGTQKNRQYFKKIHTLRFKMNEKSLFWNRTQRVYKKLALLELQFKMISKTVNDYNNRGLARRAIEDYKGALAEFNHAIKLNPNDESIYNNRALIKVQLNKHKEAIKDFDHALALKPDFLEILNNRAIAKLKNGDIEGALLDLDSFLSQTPQHPQALMNRSICKKEKGDLSGSLADIDQAIQFNPQSERLYNNRGMLKKQMGDLQGALKDLNQAIILNPKDSKLFQNRGLLKRALLDDKGAIEDWNQAIYLFPQNGQYYYLRGIAKFDNSDNENAFLDLQQAINLDPQLIQIYRYLAMIEIGRKKFKKALKLMEVAIDEKPKDHLLHNIQGIIHQELNKQALALRDYNKSIQLNPSFDTAYLNRGYLLYQSGDITSASKDISQAIRLNPTIPRYYEFRAKIYKTQDKDQKALKDYLKVIELKPQKTKTYLEASILLKEQNQREKAIRLLEKGLQEASDKEKLLPSYLDHLYEQSLLLSEKGQLNLAKSILQKYKKFASPIHSKWAKAYLLLEKLEKLNKK